MEKKAQKKGQKQTTTIRRTIEQQMNTANPQTKTEQELGYLTTSERQQ